VFGRGGGLEKLGGGAKMKWPRLITTKTQKEKEA